MSPHDDGAAIYKLRETPRWKCGEIYTWNNAELYAVECSLCDDKNLCTMTDFATHMKVCHRSWECCSEDSLDNKINSNSNSNEEEKTTANGEIEQSSKCTVMTQAVGKVDAQGIDAKEQEMGNKEKKVVKIVVVEGLTQQQQQQEQQQQPQPQQRRRKRRQSVVLEVTVDEERQVLRDIREVTPKTVVGEAIKTSDELIKKDETWRMQTTNDETEDSLLCAPLSTDLQNDSLHKIAAGQETPSRTKFNETQIQSVVPVANGKMTADKEEEQQNKDCLQNGNNPSEGVVEVIDAAPPAMKDNENKEISKMIVIDSCENRMIESMEQLPEILLSNTPNEAATPKVEQPQSLLQLNYNKILYLIELYEAHPRLWTPTHPEFSETDLCRDSWVEITQKFNAACRHMFKTNELKVGIATLCQRYRAEKQRLAEELASDDSNSTNISTKFPHYDALQFLDNQPDAMQSRRSILQQQNFKIIDIYKRYPVLWHSAYKMRATAEERAKALEDISNALQLDQIQLSSKSVQRRLHALHKCYRKEKINYLFCLRDNRTFRTNFKHYNQMQFVEQHVAPFICSICGKIFEKLHEHSEHMRTNHENVVPLEEDQTMAEEKKVESEEKPQHCPMDEDMDQSDEVIQMLDKNDNLINKDQSMESQEVEKTNNVECNQTHHQGLLDEDTFREEQDKVLMDGTDVDKFLANLLEKEPFMEIASEIFNDTNPKHEVVNEMHKIENNDFMDLNAPNLKEDALSMQKLPFDFSMDFKNAMDEIARHTALDVNSVSKKEEQNNTKGTNSTATGNATIAMITPTNFTLNSVNSTQHQLTSTSDDTTKAPLEKITSSATHQVFDSTQHLMSVPHQPTHALQHMVPSPEYLTQSQPILTQSSQDLTHPPQQLLQHYAHPLITNGAAHFFGSTPHIIIAQEQIVNPGQTLINTDNNTYMNLINASGMQAYEGAHFSANSTENTVSLMQENVFHVPNIYFNTQQGAVTNTHDTIAMPGQGISAPEYAIISSDDALALINGEIYQANIVTTHNNAFRMAPMNSYANVGDLMPETVNATPNLSRNQNAENNATKTMNNIMNIPQNNMNNTMNMTQHLVNIPQENMNYTQQNNVINAAQFPANKTQPKTYYVTQQIVNIPMNALNNANSTTLTTRPTHEEQKNLQTEQRTSTAPQNKAFDAAANSIDNCKTHTRLGSSSMGQSDSCSKSCESFESEMQQLGTASCSITELSSSETFASSSAYNPNKTDFKNLKLRLKKTFTTQSDDDSSFDCNSQDSAIQCEIYIENSNASSLDCIPLVTVQPPTRLNVEQTHTLIHIYKQQPALWNPTDAGFISKNARHIAWKTITVTFNKYYKLRLQWQTVYKKMTDLVKYYRKEKERIEASENLPSKWYYYKDFEFLNDYLDITSDIHKSMQEKELNMKIITMYKTFPQLWNTHLQAYKKRLQRNRHIETMNNCLKREFDIHITVARLKRKLLDFRTSFRQEKEKRIECAKNNEAFESFYEYYQPLEFIEPHVAPFICNVCGLTCTKLTEIWRHYRTTKHQKISKKNVRRVEFVADDDSKYICDICGAKFTMRNNLIYHLNRHSGKRTHLCQSCPKSFYNSTALRVHERSHTKECPYICEQCGQRFVNNSKLNQHIKRHSNKREFPCNQCNKAFFTAMEREKHMKRHLNIRDKMCPICGKTFVVGSSIYTHMELHADVKKYVCKICDQRFSQNSGLYRHMKKHTMLSDSTETS